MPQSSTPPSKTIDTLVEDIYHILQHGVKPSTEAVERLGRDLATTIAEHLEAPTRPPEAQYLRMSNIGKNPTQLWHDINGSIDTNGPKPSDRLRFLYGSILELLALFLAAEANHSVTDRQRTVEVDGVKGSIDACIDGEVVDVKSASSRAFNKFSSESSLRAENSFGYIEQISGYANALAKTTGWFLAINKETGELQLTPVQVDDVRPRIKSLREMLGRPEPPPCEGDIEFGQSGNRILGFPCAFCKHKDKCWKDANGGRGLRTFKYSNGIKYFTKIEKEPNVEEVI